MEVPNVKLSDLLPSFASPGSAPSDETSTTVDKTVAPPVEADTTTTVDKDVAPPVEAVTATTADKEVAPPVAIETVEKNVAPPVVHEKVVEEHEQREQTVVDKERHQDVYKTTVQPVKETEVLPEKVQKEETATEVKEIDHDDGAVKDKIDADNAGFQSTTEQGKTVETKTEEPTIEKEGEVKQHLHETVQPVIEKETIQPTVTEKKINVKEIHHEPAKDAGITTEAPISAEESKGQAASTDAPVAADEIKAPATTDTPIPVDEIKAQADTDAPIAADETTAPATLDAPIAADEFKGQENGKQWVNEET